MFSFCFGLAWCFQFVGSLNARRIRRMRFQTECAKKLNAPTQVLATLSSIYDSTSLQSPRDASILREHAAREEEEEEEEAAAGERPGRRLVLCVSRWRWCPEGFAA